MSQKESQGRSYVKIVVAFLGAVATVVAIIAGAIQIIESISPTPTPTPQPSPSATPTFLEQITGSYSLNSWTNLGQPGLGVQITEGELAIAQDGPAVWKLMVEKTFTPNPGSLEVLAKGDVIPSQSALEGDREHHCNEIRPSDNWGPIDPNLVLAVRGIDPASGSIDAFSLSFSVDSSGAEVLEMTNNQGKYRWKRKTGPLSTAPPSLLSYCDLLAPSD